MDMKVVLRALWDRIAAVVLVVLGALALLLGWLGVSRSALSAEQIPYVVSGGLFGIMLVGLGSTLWLSADIRDEWRKLDRLEQLLERAASAGLAAVNGAPLTLEQPADARANGRRRAKAAATRGSDG